jgi:adenylylsulfate kinase
MIIQFCGLPDSGKTTLARAVRDLLKERDIEVEILDGDEYRRALYPGLGFSREERAGHIRRLAFLAARFSSHDMISIICAINPFEDIRQEIALGYADVKTVFIDCDIAVLLKRDTKNLYRRAMLPNDHPDKIFNLTGVNAPFEAPCHPDLVIKTDAESVEASSGRLLQFILSHYQRPPRKGGVPGS